MASIAARKSKKDTKHEIKGENMSKTAAACLRRFLLRNSMSVSQAGQDYWIYGEAFNEKRGGFFVDIGACDGIELSNTYILETRYKWQGICIEANPIFFKELRRNRRSLCLHACLDQSERLVQFVLKDVSGGIIDEDCDNKKMGTGANEVISMKTVTLLKVLEEFRAPKIIDYLSIDVEGAEERILAQFDFRRYTFRTITIERPTELLRDLFRKNGYLLVREVPELDCFYIHRDFSGEYWQNISRFYQKRHMKLRWK